MMKENKKSFKSQQKIYKALRKVLLTKPLNEVSVTDITSECAISRSTFYRNFNNIIEILEVIFEWFYNDYQNLRKDKENQLLFFFEYWYWHRDLINIITKNNSGIIKNCMTNNETSKLTNEYLIDLKYSILTSILSKWSETKIGTPEELEKMTRKILEKPCIDIMLF